MSLQEEYVKEICPYCNKTGECNITIDIEGTAKCDNYEKMKGNVNESIN